MLNFRNNDDFERDEIERMILEDDFLAESFAILVFCDAYGHSAPAVGLVSRRPS